MFLIVCTQVNTCVQTYFFIMKYIYIVILNLVFFAVKAQTFGGNITMKPSAYKAEVLDEAQYNITYQYNFLQSANNKNSLDKGFVVLQLGNNFVKFTDFYTLKNDSLAEVYSHQSSIGTKELNERLSIFKQIKIQKNLFTNITDNKIIFQSDIIQGYNYEYETDIPNLQWNIEQETDEILGYNVQKATVTYSGRKWIAWFTPEIPIQYGPYVFNGLPGLIVKLYDDKSNFTFLINSIDKQAVSIYKRLHDRTTKVTKQKYIKVEKDFHERPEMYFDNSAVRGADIKSGYKIPYNPIEVND